MSARPLDCRHSCTKPEHFEARASFSSSGVGPFPESSPVSELPHLNPHSPEVPAMQQCGDGSEPDESDPSHAEKAATPSPEADDSSRKPRGPVHAEVRELPSRDSAEPVPSGKQKPLPGSRASRVKPSELWSAWFGAVSSADCSLGVFFHSLRELPRGDHARGKDGPFSGPLTRAGGFACGRRMS